MAHGPALTFQPSTFQPNCILPLLCEVKPKSEFIQRISDLLGKDAEQLLAVIEEGKAPVSIRHNPLKTTHSNYREPVSWSGFGEYLPERPVFTVDPLFHAGCYYVQEASSMFLEQAVKQHVDLHQPLTVLDLCAAPGGKSTLLASLLKDTDVLISNEINKTRADVLTENIQKWGSSNVMVTRNEPSDFSHITDLFDLIVVDAPCSGEGMFRKDKRAIEEWSVPNVLICEERQRHILDDIWPSLKPGGVLIYSTCTFNLEENENMVKWVTEELDAENEALSLEGFTNISTSIVEGISAARFFPHRSKGEGLFMSVLRKHEGQKARVKQHKPTIKSLEKKELEMVDHLLKPLNWNYFHHRSQVFAASSHMTDVLHRVSPYLYPLHIGVAIGELKGKDLIPAPGLAFSTALADNSFKKLEVNREQALGLLSRETPELDLNESGWVLCTYQGHGLVWIKAVHNRYNNYYPKEWRIRSDFRTLED